MLKYLEKLDTTNRSSACAPAIGKRRLRLAVVGEAEIDLVDDEPAAQPRDVAAIARSSSGATCVPVGFDGDAISAPRVRAVPRALDQAGGKLVARFGPDRNADGVALEHADEMAVARVARVGEQDLVVAVDEERHHQQQRRGRSGGHDHALRRDRDAEALGIVARRSPARSSGMPSADV